MEDTGDQICRKIIKLLQASYNGSTSQIRIRNELSKEFTIESGVRQGDIVSLLLFNIVIKAIKAFQGMCGVQSDKDHSLTDLMFANDQFWSYGYTAHAHSYGLKINADKTKVMAKGSQVIVYLESTQLKQAQELQ